MMKNLVTGTVSHVKNLGHIEIGSSSKDTNCYCNFDFTTYIPQLFCNLLYTFDLEVRYCIFSIRNFSDKNFSSPMASSILWQSIWKHSSGMRNIRRKCLQLIDFTNLLNFVRTFCFLLFAASERSLFCSMTILTHWTLSSLRNWAVSSMCTVDNAINALECFMMIWKGDWN